MEINFHFLKREQNGLTISHNYSTINVESHWLKLVAPYLTLLWGDIPAKRWGIHPRPKAVAFCCRGEVWHHLIRNGKPKKIPIFYGEMRVGCL